MSAETDIFKNKYVSLHDLIKIIVKIFIIEDFRS